MMDRRQFIGLVTAVAVSASRPRQGQAEKRMPPQDLRAFLEGWMRREMIPGLQVAVLKDGKTVFAEAIGLADLENSVPVRRTTRFQIASVTKAFIGVAVMQLVEAGRLKLEAPIGRYLNDLPASWQPVTIAQLASHTSGLPDIVEDIGLLRLVVPGDAEASWRAVQARSLDFAPGGRFAYNQTNYVVLAKLIERLHGAPFTQYLQTEQFDRAGMSRTCWGDDSEIVPESARTYTPYARVGGQVVRRTQLSKVHVEFPAMLRGCGGLNSTADDVARWLVALESGKLLQSKGSYPLLRQPRLLADGRPGPWGIGAFANQRRPHPVFYGIGAAKAAFGVYPEDRLCVVLLTNLSADLGLTALDQVASKLW